LSPKKEIYKGREIVFEIPDDDNYVGEIRVEIDGQHLHVIRLEDGTYGAHLLPYSNYPSLLELAKDVIDKVPQFRSARQ